MAKLLEVTGRAIKRPTGSRQRQHASCTDGDRAKSHAGPVVPRDDPQNASRTVIATPRNGKMAHRAQDRAFLVCLELRVAAAGTTADAAPFFCASPRALAVCVMSERSRSKPLSWIQASMQASPLPQGASSAALSNARSVSTACSAISRSRSDNLEKSNGPPC
jgi:hypothetical protein